MGPALAFFFRKAGESRLTEVPNSEQAQDIRPDHELSAERPGRVHELATVARHAIERDDLHRREKERFAQSLAADLDRRLANSEYDRSSSPRHRRRSA